jgi:hypothetical protein
MSAAWHSVHFTTCAIKNPPRFHIQCADDGCFLMLERDGLYRLSEIFRGNLTDLRPSLPPAQRKSPLHGSSDKAEFGQSTFRLAAAGHSVGLQSECQTKKARRGGNALGVHPGGPI